MIYNAIISMSNTNIVIDFLKYVYMAKKALTKTSIG